MKQKTVEQKTAENVKTNTINEKYEQLVGLDLFKLKPFQVHFVEDVILIKEFIENQRILNEENGEDTSAFDTLIDVILNKEITDVSISVGKKCKNHFNAYLHVHTNAPCVGIGNWDKTEPTFCITDGNYRTSNTLCLINMTNIQNLTAIMRQGYICDICDVSFSYGNIDYIMTFQISC